MLHKKLFTLFIVSAFTNTALANTMDEQVHCTSDSDAREPNLINEYVYCKIDRDNFEKFEFSISANTNEVISDFGKTTTYELDLDGRVKSAHCAPCRPEDDECRIKKPRWGFYKNEDGTWTIKTKDKYAPNAICISSATSLHIKVPW